MFLEFAKTLFRYIWAFFASDYGKLKQDDDEKDALQQDSVFIIIRDSFEQTLMDD